MTDVGPPDCATKRFPTSSSIIFLLLPRRAEANQLSMFGSPSKSERNHANEPRSCQRGNHTEFPCERLRALPPERRIYTAVGRKTRPLPHKCGVPAHGVT